jgi:hypothetical protein
MMYIKLDCLKFKIMSVNVVVVVVRVVAAAVADVSSGLLFSWVGRNLESEGSIFL